MNAQFQRNQRQRRQCLQREESGFSLADFVRLQANVREEVFRDLYRVMPAAPHLVVLTVVVRRSLETSDGWTPTLTVGDFATWGHCCEESVAAALHELLGQGWIEESREAPTRYRVRVEGGQRCR